MSKRISLVLEGGGMRGAYTSGCLAWLIDEGIEFDSAYGISTGAVHLCSYLIKEKRYLYELSTDYIADKALIGIRPFLKEGHYVGYDYLFDHILPVVFKFDIQRVLKTKVKAKIGLYDLEKGETIYHPVQAIDEKMDALKAACSLPIIGPVVEYNGRKYLDGGITKMIPIEESIKDGNDKHLIITTKPADFVRKPARGIVKLIMRLWYLKYPCVKEDYAVRHINYQTQIDLIKSLCDEGKASLIYPSKTIPVSRTSGDKEHLRILYDLGYADMESKKEEIYKLLEK